MVRSSGKTILDPLRSAGGSVLIRVHRLRRLGGAAASLFTLAAITLFATPARAAGDGYVRLAHLSPDTPAVDVYLRADGSSAAPQVFKHVAYGDMSQYLRLPVGDYQVAMRQAGAAAATPPVISTSVSVRPDGAYTVAGVGRFADLGLRVLQDDLKLPDAGKSKVRIMQASVKAPVLSVAGKTGTPIADGVAFATATPYKELRPGKWTMRVQPEGSTVASDLPCTLGAGNVYSLLVLDKPDGSLTTQLHVDAERQGSVPLGGVATGLGGSQPASRLPMVLLVATIAALLTAALVIGLRRRPRPA
jgi:hypothetical protein